MDSDPREVSRRKIKINERARGCSEIALTIGELELDFDKIHSEKQNQSPTSDDTESSKIEEKARNPKNQP